MKEYKINEVFYSLQGEGLYAGTPAVFIRFSGCNLRCSFCDTKHNEGRRLSLDALLREVEAAIDEAAAIVAPPLVVLTGGEPTLQADDALCEELARRFEVVAMESNGTLPAPSGVTFLTISPKDDFVEGPIEKVVDAEEVKLVYTGENDPEVWRGRIKAWHYFLQPCDTGDPARNLRILNKTIAYIKEHPWWRLSLQTQKIINVR